MTTSVVLCGLAPHPAILLPEVGRGEERKVLATRRAMDRLASAFIDAGPETLLVITPHGPVFRDALSVRDEAELIGDLSGFGAPEVRVRYLNDSDLASALVRELSKDPSTPAVLLDRNTRSRYMIGDRLDHGVVVPVSFLARKGFAGRMVVLNIGFLSLLDLYRAGIAVERACRSLGRRVAVLCSGDLSHRLTRDAPAGYSPKGEVFDRELINLLRDFEPSKILTLPKDLIEEAGECGLRPIALMLGILDRVEVSSQVLSYEGPFGVGYSVALFTPKGELKAPRLDEINRKRQERMNSIRSGESYPVSLARKAVEEYVKTGRIIGVPKDVPAEFLERGGVFVSIHKEGDLRGCIGTTEATTSSLAAEIISNAVSAAARDPRFEPVDSSELDYLDYSVDVLSPSEPVESLSDLDPKVYGVICEKGRRRGLLLPDLPGVNTVEEQVSIAKRKAGIGEREKDVRLYRFRVTRYH